MIDRRSSLRVVLVIACLLSLAGHVLGGHAHADPFVAALLETHEPGDAHRDVAHRDVAVSCDAVLVVSGPSAPAPPTPATTAPPIASAPMIFELEPVSFAGHAPLHSPPLFLLHSALLI